MNALQQLLSNRWILKSEDAENYYQIKDQLKRLRKFIQEKFGYHIIITPLLIKLEKIPGFSEPWMGIQDFQSVVEYQMLCYILMYLEDKEIEQQFVLSNITEFVQLQGGSDVIDWTRFTTRKQFVRVMKFCVKNGLVKLNDGEEELFSRQIDTEVLYENTGVSRSFMRNFFMDILPLQEPEAFQKSIWFDNNDDRGIVRRQRVYRRLLLSCGVYKEADTFDDFSYIRNYRYQIEKDFQTFLPCDLHVYKSSAFLVLEDYKRSGYFPKPNNTIDETILCVMRKLNMQEKVMDNNETWVISFFTFLQLVEEAISDILFVLPKLYREKGVENYAKEIVNQMVKYGFIKQREKDIVVFPIIGKVNGYFEGVSVNE